MNEVSCKKCGHVHFEINLSEVGGELYPRDLRSYQKCFRCGGSYRQFRDALKNDAPMGSTIQPILARDQ